MAICHSSEWKLVTNSWADGSPCRGVDDTGPGMLAVNTLDLAVGSTLFRVRKEGNHWIWDLEQEYHRHY